MKRRNFLTFVGVGMLATNLPVAFVACSFQENTPKARGDWQAIGKKEDLLSTGKLASKNSPAGSVLVIASQSGSEPFAVNPTCTHKGCDVTWVADGKKFSCHCHGSEFAADGKVLKGPATEALKTYAVKIEGNSVLIKQAT